MILDLASKDPVLGYELDDMREDIQYAAVFEVLSPERETPGSTHVVWIHDHEGNGEPILAMRVVQAFFRAFSDDGIFWLSWAETCSKPRVGQFGGGAVVCTRERIDHFSTQEWIGSKINEYDLATN